MPSPDKKNKSKAPTSRNDRPKRLATAALLVTLALIFSYVEAMIPSPVALPGVKLGLANLVILVALYQLDLRYAFAISLVRIVISGLLFSGVFGILYSMAGGILSLLIMYFLKKTGLFSIIGVSMAGGVFHNIGQLLIASLLVSDLRMFIYMPILMFSGLISGIAIGIFTYYILKALPGDILNQNSKKPLREDI